MSASYENLPLADLAAPKVLNTKSRVRNSPSAESIEQDAGDARTVLKAADLDIDLHPHNIREASEKYMIETRPLNAGAPPSEILNSALERQKGNNRKPHYTRLIVSGRGMIFQSACCLPLKVIAASLDGKPVSGRILFCRYTEDSGGKLVYEFLGKGMEMIVDLKRGESTRAQRLVFREVKDK